MDDESKFNDPERLDRLIEIMHHFHCLEPQELEKMLALPADSLTRVFREKSVELLPEIERGLARGGVRRTYIRDGGGPMLEDTIDAERLSVMVRHVAHLLEVICNTRRKLEEAGSRVPLLRHVTDGRQKPTALEEELINLLIEALSDPAARDRLLKFIRKEAENRGRPGPPALL